MSRLLHRWQRKGSSGRILGASRLVDCFSRKDDVMSRLYSFGTWSFSSLAIALAVLVPLTVPEGALADAGSDCTNQCTPRCNSECNGNSQCFYSCMGTCAQGCCGSECSSDQNCILTCCEEACSNNSDCVQSCLGEVGSECKWYYLWGDCSVTRGCPNTGRGPWCDWLIWCGCD